MPPSAAAFPFPHLRLEALESREVFSATPFAGAGIGLVGNYFSDPNLANLAMTRIDATVTFNWGNGSPAAGLPADNFSVRWVGRVQAQFSETYTFFASSDEGVRLWVNGQLLVNQWANSSPGEFSGSVALTAGEVYDLRLEYVDRSGSAAVGLQWQSASTPKAVIPAAQLYGVGRLDAAVGSAGGSIGSVGDAYTLTSAGTPTATADAGRFLYETRLGDATLMTRVSSVSGAGTAAEAGLAFRQGTDAGAMYASVVATPGGQAKFAFRNAAGTAEFPAGAVSITGPVWLKLERDGDMFFGYVSATGADGSWNLVGTALVPLADTALAGLFVASDAGATATAAFSDTSVSAGAPLGANIDSVKDWSLSNVFVDLYKQSRTPLSFNRDSSGQPIPAATDANGWPTEDFEVFLQTGAHGVGHVYSGTYKVSFTGQADLGRSITPGRLENVVYDPVTNRTTADLIVSVSDAESDWYVVLQFRNAVGVRDIKVIRPGYAADTQQVFTNEFLAAIRPFETLRLMDILQTNNSPNVNWFERSLPTDASQATTKGVAWEYVVQLANEAQKDVWINIPFHATDDYVRNLAQFLKTNLGQDRVVYVEYSNELWNTIFQQSLDNIWAAVAEVEAGIASGTPSSLVLPGEVEAGKRGDGTWVFDYTWAMRRTAAQIKRVSDIFGSVWGANAITNRVRPVLGGQLVNSFILDTQLAYLNRVHGDPRSYLTAVTGTSFMNLSAVEYTTMTTDEILAYLATSVQGEYPRYEEYAVKAALNGLKSFASEGGVDTFGENNIEAKKAAALDPRMAQVVSDFLREWYEHGGSQFNWFVAGATDYDTRFGTWGLTNDITDLSTPKFEAVAAAAAAPAASPTIGTMIPNAIPGAGYVNSPAPNDATVNAPAGKKLDYVVRTPVAGAYRLTINYTTNQVVGRALVKVNGVAAGEIDLTAPGGYGTFRDSSTLSLQLGQGLSIVTVEILEGNFDLARLAFEAPVGVGDPTNQPPTIVTPAGASASSPTQATLTALGGDDAGEAGLTYTWQVVAAPSGAPPVTFSANGTNAAKSSTATFGLSGAYTVRVTVRDAQGVAVTSEATASFGSVLTSLAVTPSTTVLSNGRTRQFAASGLDQFGQPIAASGISWSVVGAGSVDSNGLYTAPSSGTGSTTVRASAGGSVTGSATVNYSPAASQGFTYGGSGGWTGVKGNGSAGVSGGALVLTDGQNQAGSAFHPNAVNVAEFRTQFHFRIGDQGFQWTYADGIAFVIQGAGATSLGYGGQGLGYGDIPNSVALKFDPNGGVAVYTNGEFPGGNEQGVPDDAFLTGHLFRADITYDGTTLFLDLTDTASETTYSYQFTIDIAAAVGDTEAYVGFTGGTGGLFAVQSVADWSYTPALTPPPNQYPTVATPAAATALGTTMAFLAVLGADDGGESNLTYTWEMLSGPAAVSFSANATNAAKAASATFTTAGSYTFRVTITDAAGATTTTTVGFVLTPVLTGLVVSPGVSTLTTGVPQQFTVRGLDQLGQPMTLPDVTWSVDGSGTITPSGRYTPAGEGTATIRAQAGGLDATAAVSVRASVSPPPVDSSPINSPSAGKFDGIAVGTGSGAPAVRIVDPATRTVGHSITSLDAAFAGGVRVATADVTGDGVLDLIAASGPGAAAVVVVFDGTTGKAVARITPFESTFTGGTFVAAGDVDGDGFADVVVSPDEGGGPVLALYRGRDLARGSVVEFDRFMGIRDDEFRGGARVAIGDVDGDGFAEIVVAAGINGGPRVSVWSGAAIAAGGTVAGPELDFFAFEESLRNGAYVAAGDVNGDGFADLIVGGGPGGGPRVRVIDGGRLWGANGFGDLDDRQDLSLANFFAGDDSNRTGVRAAARDVNADGRAEVVTGSGEGSTVMLFTTRSLSGTSTPTPTLTLDPFDAEINGVFVG